MSTAPVWHCRPYIPYNRRAEEQKPFICRLAPGESGVDGEVYGAPEGIVLYKRRNADGAWQSAPLSGGVFSVYELETETDYELYARTPFGDTAVRLVRPSAVPGKVINYLHPDDETYAFSGCYLCSPSIVRLPSGRIITSMDLYEHDAAQNLTILMKSDDGGASWSYLCELFPLFWGKLLYHRKALYMFGTSTEYGDLLVGKSTDEGETWSPPTVIGRGSCSPRVSGFHRAPTVFLNEDNKLLTAVEYGSHQASFESALVFINENDDLLDSDNWHISPFLPLDNAVAKTHSNKKGGIEGNLVLAPDGTLMNMLRYEANTAMLLKADIHHPEKGFIFDRTVELPLAHTKFEIQVKDGVYYMVGNRPPRRNILSLYTSRDLIHWAFSRDILNYVHMDQTQVAFQYPAFLFDGDGMLILSRTAFGGANSFHNANYQTLHRITL